MQRELPYLHIGTFVGVIIGDRIAMERYDYLLDDDEEPRDGLRILLDNIRCEAASAMEACEDDAVREAVYAKIQDSINHLRSELQTQGEAIIAEFRQQQEGAKSARAEGTGGAEASAAEGEGTVDEHMQKIKGMMDKAEGTLRETLDALKPQSSDPAPAV
ncbi:MAG: hypothetical protein ACTTH3_05965 [Schwartzia sp. (in: firmicutes)]